MNTQTTPLEELMRNIVNKLDWENNFERWISKDIPLIDAIHKQAAEHIEDFLATHDPAYGYTIDIEGWDSQKAAQQTIEHMLREKSTWIEQALLPLSELKPELKEQVNFWLSVVHDIGDLKNPAIVGEITYLDTNETLTFTDSEAYLSELNNALNVRGINGWKHTTHTTDVDTRYQVACLTYGEFGEEVDKDAFYRLHEQYGADMGLWGDSQQWIVQKDRGYYIPETPSRPTDKEIKDAHWQVDNLVAKTSPQEFFDNALKDVLPLRNHILFNVSLELTVPKLPLSYLKKFNTAFLENKGVDEKRQWFEFGAFKRGQIFATKPSDLNRSKPAFVKYLSELYPQAVVALHNKIESMSQRDLAELMLSIHNYIQIPRDPLQAVTENGEALEYIADQTPEICLAAVQNRGWALEYVKEQTPEICLAAVKQSGFALMYVKEQTPEICLAAVKQSGFALAHVKKQTPEICLAAVLQQRDALKYVNDKTLEIYRAAGQLPPAQEQSYDLQIPVSDKLTARVSIKVKLEEAAHRSNKERSSSTNLTPTKEVNEGR